MMAPAELAAALPQYDIGVEIGRGASGVVHGGTHRALARGVAVKRLPAGLASDPGMRARFGTEARLLAKLDHPHIVPVYDFVESETACVLVLERLDGGTLSNRFRTQGLTMEQSCAVTLAMLAGLHAAHQNGVLHLDIKPQNVLFAAKGMLKVADFGIARIIGGGETLATNDGKVLGTPAYIAPEQVRGVRLSPATDVYAAATVLYLLLSGTLPHSDEGGAVAVVYRHAYDDPGPISHDVPSPLAAVVMRGVARDPAQRPGSAEEFASAVARAATESFGPGWLERSGVPLQLAPSVLAATAAVPPGGDGSRTLPLPPVHPAAPLHTQTVGLDDIGQGSLVPVRAVLRLPPSPLVPALLGALGCVLLVLFALLGPAAPVAQGGTVDITVGGASPSASPAAPVRMDLTAPQVIAGSPVAGAGPGGTVHARLALSAVGVPLGETTSGPVAAGKTPWQTTVELPPITRWIAGGAVHGRVDLVGDGGGVVGSREFTVRTSQPPYLSLMGAGAVLLLLFAVAYIESVLRSLRRGRRRVTGVVAAGALGAVLGAAVALTAAVMTSHEPAVATVIACGVLGGGAWAAAGVAARRAGTRRA